MMTTMEGKIKSMKVYHIWDLADLTPSRQTHLKQMGCMYGITIGAIRYTQMSSCHAMSSSRTNVGWAIL